MEEAKKKTAGTKMGGREPENETKIRETMIPTESSHFVLFNYPSISDFK